MAERKFTHDELIKVAEDAIGLFIEYRDVHGFIEQDAKLQALAEVAEGYSPQADAAIEELHEWQKRGEARDSDAGASPYLSDPFRDPMNRQNWQHSGDVS